MEMNSGALPAERYESLDNSKNESNAAFTPEQLAEIETKRRILSSLAYFIGKDFQMPVELNQPGAGWHWDFKENVVRIDPKDLLEKPMEYLRFVISHEGGHRRISRTEFIPTETWRQPGFSFMMNAIEDPRDNNFVAENYPRFRDQMDTAYESDLDMEDKSKEKAIKKLGHQPRFMQAGFEYIKQWFREQKGEESSIDESLPEEVKSVVSQTLEAARTSWWTYPSRQEADESEELITKYAQASFKINMDKIWPEFQKLVEKDMEDQQTQELLDDMQKGKAEGTGSGLPQELKDKLTPDEQKELEDAIDKAIDEAKTEQEQTGETPDESAGEPGEEMAESKEAGGEMKPESKGKPINLDSLSTELKQKIKDFIDSLPEDSKKDLQQKAKKTLADFEKELNDEIEGKMSETPDRKSDEDSEIPEQSSAESHIESGDELGDRERRRQRIEAMFETDEENQYQKTLEKVSGLIDMLTADLRDVFVQRKTEKYESGYRSGRRWNIRQRIREKVAGIPLFKTEAREQKESESEEMDYAISLMVDLSGSMQSGGKIQEAFKSAVVLAETLNNLGMKYEIVGFQDVLLEFKSFEDQLNETMREKLNQMILEVYGDNPDGHNNPGDNDDGKCLSEASEHLATQIAKSKFIIVISDGMPETSYKSSSALNQELKDAITSISANTNQKLIGLGLKSHAVADFYDNNISGISTEEMVETLGGLLREIIEKY